MKFENYSNEPSKDQVEGPETQIESPESGLEGEVPTTQSAEEELTPIGTIGAGLEESENNMSAEDAERADQIRVEINGEEESGVKETVEDTIARQNNGKELKRYLWTIAGKDGNLTLTQEDGRSTVVNVNSVLSTVDGVREGRPEYDLKGIPGKSLRESVKKIMENEKTGE